MNTLSDLNPETPKQVQTAFIFDVDSVITDPQEKKIIYPEIVDILVSLLSKGHVLTFNTGRSTEWVIRNVFPFLLQKDVKGKLFDKFLIVGEKGGTWAEYKNGGWAHFKDKSISIPESIQSKALELAAKEPFSSIGANLDPKESMFSWEMLDGMNIEKYQKIREPLVKSYRQLIEKESLSDKINVDPTTIAIDIDSKLVGKHLGAKRVLDWLKSININPSHFVTIGDSESDLEMADELHLQGKSVEFWYVNPSKPLSVKKPYPIKVSKEEFTKGTVEMLEKFNSN